MQPSSEKKSFIYLDFLRGASAFLVLIGHARAFCMEPYASNGDGVNFFARVIYFITGFGHQSVMVFFVLSGFLIGRHVLDLAASNTWSWSGYLIDRVSRLWLVLIPCLILTAVFDYTGVMQDTLGFYQGKLQSTMLVGIPPPGIDSRLETAFANLFFLQKITSPVFGSNGPLWSLSYEFWYYLLFPCITLIFFAKQKWKLFYLFALVLICLFMPRYILIYGLIWLTGAIAAFFSQKITLSLNSSRLLLALAVAAALSVLGYSRLPQNSSFVVDMSVGLSCGLLVFAIASRNWPVLPLLAPPIWLSKMSYSLYLLHMPVLAWLWVVPMQYARQPFGASALANMIVMIVVAVFLAWIMYLCFEKNTNQVRFWLKRKILKNG